MNKQLDKIHITIKGSFPLTILNSQTIDVQKKYAHKGIITSAYKSSNVNAQQFHKPISKTLSF